MTAVTPWPPFAPNDAGWEITDARLFIGGPPGFIQNAALRAGDAMPTTAAAELAEAYIPGNDRLTLDDVSAFILRRGTVNLRVTSGGAVVDHFFTYFNRDNTTLLNIQRVGGPEIGIPAGTPATQWRELTDFTGSIRRSAELSGSSIVHAMAIDGVDWDSLLLRQYASVYAEFRYWNDAYGIWTDWIPRFLGYLDPVKPRGRPGYATWAATAGAERKILSIAPTTPVQIGNMIVPYTAEASPHLANLALEPYEGNGAADFSAARLYDGDRLTGYVSRDTPSTLPALPWFPTNPMVSPAGVGGVPTDARGYGLRLQTVYTGGVGIDQQSQHYIEIVNMGPDPTGWPYEDDVAAGIPAAADPTTAGAVNLATMCLEAPDIRVYLGSRNGYDEPIMLARNHTAILCRNRAAFEANNTVPDGTVIVELASCDGWQPGLDPARLHRGIGGAFALSRLGGWLALREASRGGIRFEMRYDGSAPTATVAAGGDTIASNGNLTCSGSIAAFPSSGHFISETNPQVRVYYTGKSGGTFTGCRKVNPDSVGQVTLAEGSGVRAAVFAEKWRDFVAWGASAVPGQFWLKPDDADPYDQNTSGLQAYKVWGTRDSGGAGSSFTPGTTPVAPAGIPEFSAIRRKNAMGGGIFNGYINGGSGGDPQFTNHDGGTAADWEVVEGRPVGNREPLSTMITIRLKLGEFPAAVVTVDDTATPFAGTATPSQIVRVAAGSAQPYPGALRPGERLRASGGQDFVYDYRDDSAFYGVVKYNYTQAGSAFWDAGAGPTIEAGQTLTLIYDTNPDHWQRRGYRPRYEARNSYRVMRLDVRRNQGSPSVTVQADTHIADGVITLVPGGDILPASGALVATIGVAGSAARVDEDVTITYAATSGNRITGVTTTNNRVLPPGTTMTLQVAPSFLTDAIVRVSRRPTPNDPATYLEDSVDWDTIHVGGIASGTVSLPLGDHNLANPVTEIAILCKRMSNKGRVVINEIVPYAPPYDPPDAAGSIVNRERTRLDAAYIADEMLRLAGYPANRRDCRGGPDVRGARVSSGDWWEALTEWAERTGCIIDDGPLGVVTFRPDPRVYGYDPDRVPVIEIGPDAVWGELEAEEREQFRASQTTIEASNDVALEHYIVTYPDTPGTFGSPATPVRNKRAPSLSAARAWARSLHARANGGWRLTIPIGQFDQVRPLDIVRLRLPIDEHGILFDGIDCMVLATDHTYAAGRQTGTITVERWRLA